jgi:RNA polymerase sigma-70 factor, ECF subfamily
VLGATADLTGLRYRGAALAFDDVYRDQRELVRQSLRSFGVVAADLDDVGHEVFLVVYRRLNGPSEELFDIEAWLFEICRRVAAGYRRRRFRRAEALLADPVAFAELAAVEDGASHGSLREALERLDPRTREVFLLGALAEVSVSDLALLVGCDRKTARKRLARSRERVGRILSGQPLSADSTEPPAPLDEGLFDPARVEADSTIADPDDSQLKVRVVTPFFAAASWRRVFITVWRRASLEEMEALAASAADVYHAAGGKFAYLTLVEHDCGAPEFRARQRILEIVSAARPYLSSYATVLNGGPSRFVVPIMNMVFFVAGIEFPTRFFGSTSEACRWTLQRAPERSHSPAELAEVFAFLRALQRAQV